MAVKIRLRRIGAKKAPFYRVVVADSRYPRDGRFIEKLGTYDPLAEADRCIAGVGILGQQRCTGKSHPHKALYAKCLTGGQHQTHAKGHAQLPQVDGGRKIKFSHHMVKTGAFVLITVFRN